MSGTRTRSRAPLVLTLLTCALGVFALFRFYDIYQSARAAFFSRQLAQVPEVTVVVHGAPYTVRDGIARDRSGSALAQRQDVLALAYEKLASERSPLFALPGIDLNAFDRTIAALASTSAALSREQRSPVEVWDVSHDLYPVDLLRSLSTLEAARRRFIASGSDEDARAYETLLEAIPSQYQTSIRRFSAAFERNVPAKSPEYATEISIISRTGALAALQELSDGARGIADQIAARQACINGATARCDAHAIDLPVPTDVEDTPQIDVPATTQRLLSLYRKERLPLTGADQLFELPSSRCTTPRSGTALLYSFYRSPGASDEVPFYVGDARFMPSARFALLPFFDYFAQHDIPFVVSVPLSYYACPEDDVDEGSVSALRDITQFARAAHLSARADGTLRAALSRDEGLLVKSIVSDHDARMYLRDALALVGTGAVPEHEERLITLALELNTRSFGLYDTMLNVVSMEHANLDLRSSGINIDAAAPYLFFVRSAFPQLFMQANPSATGLHGTLFPDTGLGDAELPYVFYSQATSSKERSAFERSMDFYTSLHEAL